MPLRSVRLCRKPGCTALVGSGYCDAHHQPAKAFANVQDQQRGSARERGYTTAWEKARKAYLAKHPLCRACESAGRVTAATVVDHITPHRGDMKKFWDAEGNWQPLCRRCHTAKTARGD